MSTRVKHTEIEAVVGHARHRQLHIARAVTDEQTVYILHSQRCKDTFPDLRDCPHSLALDRGIDLADWVGLTDQPVCVHVWQGRLRPYSSALQARAGFIEEPTR